MSQDIISDALNKIMNGKRNGSKEIFVKRSSKLLINLLEIAKNNGYIEDYKKEKNDIIVKIRDTLNECKTIKPRKTVSKSEIIKYVKRYLPAKNIGIVVVSTNKGVLTHQEVIDMKIGGCLIAYFY